jgi:hypothetical protein
MRKWLTRLLILLPVTVAGCDKPIITIDLKGQPNIPAQPAPPRFQIVINTHKHDIDNGFPPQAFLLDTERGRVWGYEGFTPVNKMPSHFWPLEVVDDEGQLGMTKEVWNKLRNMMASKKEESKQ